ncbi:hypothetical protein [Psychrosphaera haliotis]|uniref:Uncharacterized protein n=1 Tax=Psychrosphaera haliotis TaxID=555083 RepID=A0A6N8F7A4_9GAMM|nr:hypothetical protein [Psychrosphaera haliotis]MUH72044.1 hypothetical protein [Psychrosphaera haliotis]
MIKVKRLVILQTFFTIFSSILAFALIIRHEVNLNIVNKEKSEFEAAATRIKIINSLTPNITISFKKVYEFSFKDKNKGYVYIDAYFRNNSDVPLTCKVASASVSPAISVKNSSSLKNGDFSIYNINKVLKTDIGIPSKFNSFIRFHISYDVTEALDKSYKLALNGNCNIAPDAFSYIFQGETLTQDESICSDNDTSIVIDLDGVIVPEICGVFSNNYIDKI